MKTLTIVITLMLTMTASSAWAAAPGEFNFFTLGFFLVLNFLLMAGVFLGLVILGSAALSKIQRRRHEITSDMPEERHQAHPHQHRSASVPVEVLMSEERQDVY